MREAMFEGAGWTDLVEMCRSVPAKVEGDAVCTIWVRCRGAWGVRTTPPVINYKRTLALVEGKTHEMKTNPDTKPET